jgi:hypothetical protein
LRKLVLVDEDCRFTIYACSIGINLLTTENLIGWVDGVGVYGNGSGEMPALFGQMGDTMNVLGKI